MLSLIVIVGILGNALVIYVILSRPKLQTVTNILLLNLAIADVSFLLVCGSFTVAHYALLEWPLGDIPCRIIQYLLYTTCYVTIYTLTMVSVIRYLIVVKGNKSSWLTSTRHAVLICLIIWTVVSIGKIPILIVHGVSYHSQTGRIECIISGKTEAKQLFASFFVFAYALPLLIIGTLYLLIVRHVRLHKHEQTDRSHLTKAVVLIVTVFAVCWLPLQLHLLVNYYAHIPDSPVYQVLLLIWHSLVFGNSLLNPLIYHFCSKDFRNSFREVICCRREEIENEETHV